MTAVVALDLGTTAIKAALLSQQGELGKVISMAAPAIKADGGRYESDALAYVQCVEAALQASLDQSGGQPVLGMCCQRSSFLLWERASGQPMTPLISWQDDRGVASCHALREHESVIRELTGLPLTPYYLGPKLRVLLLQHPEWREKLLGGAWLLGTLDTYLIWRWTAGAQYVTDASMAARTLLMDIRNGQWSSQLCTLFDIPVSILPCIVSSTGLRLRLENGLSLQASVGDQSAALAAAIDSGQPEALVNLGTGGFVACYLHEGRGVLPGYLQTLLWQDEGKRIHMACEGTLNSIAAALASYPVLECRAEDLATNDIYCLAEPSGLGAPYFRSDLNVRFSSPVESMSRVQHAQLLLEGIIFRVVRILEDYQREFAIERACLSGGLSNIPCLCQGIAMCAPVEVFRLTQVESGLIGVGQLAAGLPRLSGGREHIVAGRSQRLQEKYGRWKVWLDELLQSRPR